MAAGSAATDGKRAVLVANGPLPSEAVPYMCAAVREADLVLGVDGGTRHLLAHGILPNVVTGDFDSLTEDEREELVRKGVRVVPTPDQDYTDLDKALTLAIHELRLTSIRIFAATGGRLDHIYSCLSTIIKHGRHADVRLVDEVGETFLVNGEVTLTGSDLAGRTLSLLAFGAVHGITTTGVKWPLENESLASGLRDGTLNVILADEVMIRVGQGDLLVMVHHVSSP